MDSLEGIKKVKHVSPEDDESVYVSTSDEETDKIDEIISTLSDEGGNISVQRKPRDATKYQYCCKVPASEFDVDEIVAKYGGGSYKCMAHRATGSIYKSFSFEADYRIQGDLDPKKEDVKSGDSIAGMDAATRLLKEMGLSPRDILGLAQNAGPRNDGMNEAVLTMMIKSQEQNTAMMSAMITAMATAFGGQKSDINVELVRLLKEPPQQTSSTDQMAQMLQLVNTAKSLVQPPAEPEPMWKEILKEVPSALGGIIREVTGSNSKPQQKQLEDPLVNYRTKLTHFLGSCIKGASRGADPYSYYEIFMSQVPDSVMPKVIEVLTDETWFDLLFGEQAEQVRQFEPWFQRLRTLILTDGQNIQPSDDSEDDDEFHTLPSDGSEEEDNFEGENQGTSGHDRDGEEDSDSSQSKVA